MCIGADGHLLASGSWDNSARIWTATKPAPGSKAAELDQLKQQYTEQQRTLNDETRSEMELAITDKETKLRRFQEDTQREIDVRRNALFKRLIPTHYFWYTDGDSPDFFAFEGQLGHDGPELLMYPPGWSRSVPPHGTVVAQQ